MKKFLFMLLATFLVLAACNAEEPKEKTEVVKQEATTENPKKEDKSGEENKEQEEESTKETTKDKKQEETLQSMTAEELKELLEYNGTGEGDTLVSAALEKGKLKAVIDLAPSDPLPAEDLAVTRYSQVSDELLGYEGWEVLTIKYVDVGTISMKRSDKESNEYGDYFPVAEIEKHLN
ncbi:hypothetical protein [Lederbergia citrea]|uniref:hypothetical protein n=1 Tax=Lederbergia citrea TaxID=2833581 RepID=UPI001BC939AD|nr:hypothetical protein [Lederbergia citrea]MBS4177728.1 hypothetical protein [Lederbergia citrea]